MVLSILHRFLFPPPPSLLITAMSVISVISLANAGISEIRGKHLQYSKFWDLNLKKSKTKVTKTMSSRTGMLVLYTPAFLAGLSSFAILPDQGSRVLFLKSALTLHFFKRIIEVLFVHKYSGKMVLDDVVVISLSYFISTTTMIYAQYLTLGFAEPSCDTKYIGSLLFLVGIGGNFYHHCILSNTRQKGEKEYKIPKGGLFSLVICPHYLFEILGFVGISFISQTLYACSFTIGTILYLIGRSIATRKWYVSKFEDFPKNVKALIPFVL